MSGRQAGRRSSRGCQGFVSLDGLRATAAPCLEYCSSESDLGHTPPPPSPPPPRQLRNLITRLLPEQAFASLRRLPTISATRVSACPHTPIPIGSRGSLRGQPPLPQAAQFLVTIRPGPVKNIDWRATWLLSLSPPYYCTFTSKQWPQRHSETA